MKRKPENGPKSQPKVVVPFPQRMERAVEWMEGWDQGRIAYYIGAILFFLFLAVIFFYGASTGTEERFPSFHLLFRTYLCWCSAIFFAAVGLVLTYLVMRLIPLIYRVFVEASGRMRNELREARQNP